MANNMDFFDFDALDSAALDETLSFLNNYDPTPLPDPPFAGFGDFGEPMMDWPMAENPAWVPLGNADLSGGLPDALTDNSTPGFQFPNPGWGAEIGQNLEDHVMGAETCDESGESSMAVPHPIEPLTGGIPSNFNNGSHSSSTLVFLASQMNNGRLNTTEESELQCFRFDDEYAVNQSYQSTDPLHSPYPCDWPSCKSTTTYRTFTDLYNHKLDVHVAEILKNWPGSCSWPGCRSKIFFKTSKRLESHVYNIHITPLRCTATDCQHKRPFERQADLERHVASKHSAERKYKCPYTKCRYSSSFSRKDKLKQHERTYHGQFACPSNHCIYGFPTEEILWRHTSSWEHYDFSSFECDLGSCGRTSTSRFTRYDLRLHLEHDHQVSSEATQQALVKMKYPKDTLTAAHFPNGFSDFQDCKGCIEKLKDAKSGEGDKEAK